MVKKRNTFKRTSEKLFLGVMLAVAVLLLVVSCKAPSAGKAAGDGDADLDGISDVEDNCPSDFNSDQGLDVDFDGKGDACDDVCAYSFTQWISPDDGVLVMDRNKDGKIQAEDFFAEKALTGRNTANGFEDLALLDVNGDGILNRNDPPFGELRIFKDKNGDGVLKVSDNSEVNELLTFAEAGVAEVRVAYYETSDVIFKQQGTFKSTRAVELEAELESSLNQLDATQTELSRAYDVGEFTDDAQAAVNDIQTEIQRVMRVLEVENNRVAGAAYLETSSGSTVGSILTLDLDGDGLEFVELDTPATFVCRLPSPARCGDGVKDDGEVCDDGNILTETSCVYGQAKCDLCSADCSAYLYNLNGPYCGDGVLDAEEEECDSDDEFERGLCVEATCTFVQRDKQELLDAIDVAIDSVLLDTEVSSEDKFAQLEAKIRDFMITYLRSLGWGAGK